jgi:hypothetical protein
LSSVQAVDWWNTSWLYRKRITIDSTKVDADLTHFPVLIDIIDPDLASWAQDDGGDIVFIDGSGAKLNHEIESYDDGTGHLVAWVNVPTLSSTVNTDLYMYYGNSATSNQENAEGVWDSNFKMVHHLQETSGIHYDSTSNDNDGTPQGGVTQDATGKINGADDFDGSDDRVECRASRESWRNQDQGQQRAVIKDGKIYVVGGGDWGLPTFHAYIFVFDLKTGEILQQSPSLGEFDFTASETAPVVDGDMVYACPTKANMMAWKMSSNTIEWTTSGLSIWSNRIEFDGTYLYATTTDYRVVKIYASDGNIVASFDLDPDTDNENAVPPYLDETNGIIFAMGGSKLYKLSASDLSEIWNRDIGSGCLDTGSGHSRMAPIVVNDHHTSNEPWVIFGCWGTDYFYAYDYDGNQEWSKHIPEGVRAVASYNPNNGFLYIPSQGDRIYVLNVANGVEQFSITTVPNGAGFDRPCTISNDYLLFKTGAGNPRYIYIYNANNGQYITRIVLGNDLFLTCFPIAVSEGWLATGGSVINAGAEDGGIFAVKAGDGQPVDYYPLYGPHKYGYIENALTSLISVEDTLNPIDEITLEAWANLDALTTPPGNNDHLVCRAVTYCLKFAQENAGDVPRFQLYDTTKHWNNLDLSSPLGTGGWHHLVGTWDGSIMRFYVDGALGGSLSFAGTIDSTSNPTFIGSYDGGAGQSPDGRIDEVRISDICRSASWILTEYRNQHSPSTFYDVGSEEAAPVPLPTGITGRYDFDNENKENIPTIGTEFTTAMYMAISTQDNSYAVTRVEHTYDYSQQIFMFDVGTNIEEFTVTWEGNIAFQETFGPHTEGMEIWNRATSSWEWVGNVLQVGQYDPVQGPPKGPSVRSRMPFMAPDDAISKTYSTNVNDFISDGHIYVMVWAKNSHDAIVCTDYVKISVGLPPPPPVGGVWVPINKFELLAPWIGLASLLMVSAVAASLVYVKHRKKPQN